MPAVIQSVGWRERGHLPWAQSALTRSLILDLSVAAAAAAAGLNWTAANTVHYEGPKSINQGDTIHIKCEMSRFLAPMWTLNDRLINESDTRIKFDYAEGGSNRIEILTISEVVLADQGYYRCSSSSRNAHFVNVIPRLGQENVMDGNLFQVIQVENSTVVVECTLEVSNPRAAVYW